MEKRIVKTGMNTDVCYDVLQSVVGQLSDGIWENSRQAERYWRFCKIVREADGGVAIEIEPYSGTYDPNACHKWTENRFCRMSDKEVREFFAKKIKAVVAVERRFFEKSIRFSVTDETVMECLGGRIERADGSRSTVTVGFACAVSKRLMSFAA